MSLFNQAMVAAGKGTADEPPVVGVQVSEAKPFAFIETRTPQDACNALLFDGLAIGGNVLKVRRPKDYKPLPGIGTYVRACVDACPSSPCFVQWKALSSIDCD